MPCRSEGCTRETTWGGHCDPCSVLFGAYPDLVAREGTAEWSPDDPVEPPDDDELQMMDDHVADVERRRAAGESA